MSPDHLYWISFFGVIGLYYAIYTTKEKHDGNWRNSIKLHQALFMEDYNTANRLLIEGARITKRVDEVLPELQGEPMKYYKRFIKLNNYDKR